ncbi:hypothetical protein SCLCIDRAFT_363646 [Scleroderma citrinum Foug A]|uniref:Uncharacterized protein n=1 Tax=Scleroderma citrinum Foug A TaxID=1036808 RepID=A0A0C3AMT8_9AGAM|nr:hypothetical protein SCLCIDRAFT_363646 [Scleroderma citrinum Foug A]
MLNAAYTPLCSHTFVLDCYPGAKERTAHNSHECHRYWCEYQAKGLHTFCTVRGTIKEKLASPHLGYHHTDLVGLAMTVNSDPPMEVATPALLATSVEVAPPADATMVSSTPLPPVFHTVNDQTST